MKVYSEEFLVSKSFVMNELYSINLNIEWVQIVQHYQTKYLNGNNKELRKFNQFTTSFFKF